ncbi:MAG: 4Fe-4S binding protein [Spirochaetota bacterium]
MRKTYVIDRGCTLCDACFWACPEKAIYESGGCCHIDQEKCSHCGVCYKGCASEAISVTKAEGTLTHKGERS